MRFKMVKTIFKKEMIDILRDKRTLFMGIILPLILYPVIMIIMTQIMTMSMGSIEEKDINIAFDDYVVKGGIAGSNLHNKSLISRRMCEGSIRFSLGRKT